MLYPWMLDAMITGYMQIEMVDEAEELFNRMPFRNAKSWLGLLQGNIMGGVNKLLFCSKHYVYRNGMLPSLSSSFFAC